MSQAGLNAAGHSENAGRVHRFGSGSRVIFRSSRKPVKKPGKLGDFMHAKLPWAMLLLVVPAFAGCAEPQEPLPELPEPTPSSAPVFQPDGAPPALPAGNGSWIETFHASGLMPAGTSALHSEPLSYPVGADASAIYVELAWNDTRQDLDAFTQAPQAYCSEQDGALMPFCVLGTYFCADFRVHAFTDCNGDFLSPDNPSRLVVHGDELANALHDCPADCVWQAYATSKWMPTAAITWTLNVSVYYGANPWDLSANLTHLYAIDAHTTTSEQERRVIVFTSDDNITAILVELAWTDALGQDIDPHLGVWVGECTTPQGCVQEPSRWRRWSNQSGDFGSPDSPARILVQGDELADAISECVKPCYWYAAPSSKSETWAEVDWRLRVTVFRTPIPAGYTALDP